MRLKHVVLKLGTFAAVVAAIVSAAVWWPRPPHEVKVGAQVWTCSMHPQIRMDHPGRCPICGMELVPVVTAPKTPQQERPDEHSGHLGEHLSLSPHAQQMARVQTVAVEPRPLFKEIVTVGKVDYDETRVAYIAARIDGRVDDVYANFPGTIVKEGDHLVSIYSPNLYSAQQEYLIALRRERERPGRSGTGSESLLSASSRQRLKLLGITDEQLDALAAADKGETHLVIYAPIGGTVVQKNIRAGQYVRTGDSLYTIADLTHVWLILEIYESELSWVRFGQSVQVTLESDPARPFTGMVGFIEPVLNESTRTVRVRVVVQNEGGKLKPGMYAQTLIRVPIMPDGQPAPTGLEGKYACPMHPYVVADEPGKCSVCRMPLELVPGKPQLELARHPPEVLAVPAEAILTTGRRQLGYVEQQPGEFHLTELQLGPRAGDFFPVLKGLKAGERVVTRGNFLLDSQFQITGKPSLLYPEGIAGGGTGHTGHAAPSPRGGTATKARPTEHKGH